MNLRKFAAIDIGTNAMRLLIANVIEDGNETYFKKASLTRMPVRLGEDVFEHGEIGKKRKKNLMRVMTAFDLLMKVNDVEHYRACATSAMREAKNGKDIIKTIREETGIAIELISGDEEAEIIRSTQIRELLKTGKNWLFVDVGGGSTEITLFENGQVIKSHSFKIGTIRMLKNMVKNSELEHLDEWLSDIKNKYDDIKVIGSGGNINKIYKFSQNKEGKGMFFNELKQIYVDIKKYSYEDRMKILGFNPDRADVIIPAAEIFIKVMKLADIGKIHVPKIGLADGIIQLEYKKFKNKILTKQ